jgi:hypothetical protein
MNITTKPATAGTMIDLTCWRGRKIVISIGLKSPDLPHKGREAGFPASRPTSEYRYHDQIMAKLWLFLRTSILVLEEAEEAA